MEKRFTSRDYITFVIREAHAGHRAPLSGYIRSGAPLTPELRECIAEALEATEGKRGKAELKRVKNMLIAEHVAALAEELGKGKHEAAVEEVMKQRGIKSRETIFAAKRQSKKRK